MAVGWQTGVVCSLVFSVTLVTGCQQNAHCVRDPDFAHLSRFAQQAWPSPAPAGDAVSPVVAELEGPHSLEEYLAVALRQNPDIQAARKQIEALAYQVPVAASLQDPTLGATFYPEAVQTAAGPQEFALSASQKVPWHGKLAARAELAESRANAARARLAAVELETIAKVKRGYYELYFLQQATEVTQADQRLLVDIRDVAATRYTAGRASQQDVLRADLEIYQVENELIRLRQQLESAQARLARLLHIAPQTKLRALDHVPPQDVPRDLASLQRRAVAARPELHAQLAALESDRRAVELARLDYLPDVTVGATWIEVGDGGISPVSNGRDSLLLTAGINLPIYRKRLDAAVRSAEAKAVSTARTYDSLRDATLEEVLDLFSRARSEQELLVLFREDILPKARQTLQVSSRAYNAGEVDFLQLIDNWRQLLRYEVSRLRLEASLRQTMAELERTVGGFTPSPLEALPAPGRQPAPLPPPLSDVDRQSRNRL